MSAQDRWGHGPATDRGCGPATAHHSLGEMLGLGRVAAKEVYAALWYDAFRQRTVLCAQPPWISTIVPHDWGEEDDTRAAAWLQHAEIAVSPSSAAQAVEVVARDHRYTL